MMSIGSGAHAYRKYAVAHREMTRSGRAGLIIIVDQIAVHALGPVASRAGPVVYHIVAHVHMLALLRHGVRAESRRAALVMSQQIVVKRSMVAAPYGPVAVGTLVMAAVAQTLRRDAPLHGGVASAIHGTRLVDRPTDGAMVDNDVRGLVGT